MSGVDERRMEDEEEKELIGAIDELLDRGHLEPETAAYGVARQTLTKGRSSLSAKQQHVLQEYVLSLIVNRECEGCGCIIPYSEVVESLDNGGFCGGCAHGQQKWMKN